MLQKIEQITRALHAFKEILIPSQDSRHKHIQVIFIHILNFGDLICPAVPVRIRHSDLFARRDLYLFLPAVIGKDGDCRSSLQNAKGRGTPAAGIGCASSCTDSSSVIGCRACSLPAVTRDTDAPHILFIIPILRAQIHDSSADADCHRRCFDITGFVVAELLLHIQQQAALFERHRDRLGLFDKLHAAVLVHCDDLAAVQPDRSRTRRACPHRLSAAEPRVLHDRSRRARGILDLHCPLKAQKPHRRSRIFVSHGCPRQNKQKRNDHCRDKHADTKLFSSHNLSPSMKTGPFAHKIPSKQSPSRERLPLLLHITMPKYRLFLFASPTQIYIASFS